MIHPWFNKNRQRCLADLFWCGDYPEGGYRNAGIRHIGFSESHMHPDEQYLFEKTGCFPPYFTELVYQGESIMTDLPFEIHEHMWLYNNAKGRVLINGLGLGMGLRAILTKSDVKHVDIIENNVDIYNLISPTFKNDLRVKIWYGDANNFDWKDFLNCMHWDVVWHDHFDLIPGDNIKAIKTIYNKYKDHCDKQYIVGCTESVLKDIIEGNWE